MARPSLPMSFNPELAEPVEPAPLLFDRIKVPCSTCSNTLVGTEYAFFPSTVFIRGTCLKCGPRSAMFAPPVNETAEDRNARIAAELKSFSDELSVRYKEEASTVITDFLAYLDERRSA
jgi:hypothetical protein